MKHTVLIVFVVLFVLFFDVLIQRPYKRYRYYQKAQRLSDFTGKPLMVIGCPNTGGLSSKVYSYGCGDITLDVLDCQCNNSVVHDIMGGLKQYTDNSHVIFISAVLEYIESDKLDYVITELKRVSGGNLYVVNLDNILDGVFPRLGSYIENGSMLKRINVIPNNLCG